MLINISNMWSEIALLKLLRHLPAANESTDLSLLVDISMG